MELSIREVVTACRGRLICGDDEVVISGVSTDTRTIEPGMLFIPIRGENFDGHKFIDKAIENGAAAVLTELGGEYSVPAVRVEDTRRAMGRLASYYLNKLNIPTVAITGSVGKTTTKDMVASVLAKRYNVYKTQGNLNNDIGVPLTVFALKPYHTAAVIEMGMNHFGEISYLTSIVKPDVALITNVGVSHIENLGSREGILKAKCEIFEGLKSDGTAIVNGDDDMLSTLRGSLKGLVMFGTNTSLDWYADNIRERGLEGIDCTIHGNGSSVCFDVSISVPGRHMVLNALAAAAAGYALGMSAEEIKAGIEDFKPTKMRMDIIHSGDLTIINDAYNSNPVSAMAAVDVLAAEEGVRCAVLGDMFELGSFAPKLHYELGEYTAKKGIDIIVAVGELSRELYEGAKQVRNKNVYYFKTQEDFLENIDSIIHGKMTVLVKASRGMKFEKTTEKLRGE